LNTTNAIDSHRKMVRRGRIKESGMQTDTALRGFGIQKKYSPGWERILG